MIIHTDQCVSQKLADDIVASNANIVYAMASILFRVSPWGVPSFDFV